MANDEYRIAFADRVQEVFFNDGVLSNDNLLARYDALAAQIDQAIIAESARWGDAQTNSPLLRFPHWLNGVASTRSIVAQRTDRFLSQLSSTVLELRNSPNDTGFNRTVPAPLFPSVNAPVFLIDGVPQHGGNIDAGQELQFNSNSAGTILYTTDGTDPREVGGAVSSAAQSSGGTSTTSTVFPAGSSWQFNDSGQNLGTNWRSPSFNDSSWDTGNARFGFGDTGLPVQTFVESGPNGDRNITTYFRKQFTLSDNFDFASLNISRDDGVVVYLNGVEVVRDNLPENETINYLTRADDAITGNAENRFNNFDIPASLLVIGVNTIAVEVHQVNDSSSDLAFDAALTVGQVLEVGGVSLDVTTPILSRTLGSDGAWSALQSAEFVVAGSVAPQSSIRISEINFNPADPSAAEINAGHDNNDNFEFIELYNSSTTGTVDLAGMQFDDGITFTFGDVQLGPGERAVVVKDLSAFQARYGASIQVLGEYGADTSLSNAGEQVRLVDSLGQVIHDFTYDDVEPWAVSADGDGPSLEVINVNGDYSDPTNWQASATDGGTPGDAPTVVVPQVVSVIRDNGSIARPGEWSTIDVEFSAGVDLTAESLVLRNDSLGGALVDLSGSTFSHVAGSSTATWDLSSLNTPLDAAYYSVTLDSSLITGSIGGSALDGNDSGSAGGDFTAQVYKAIPGDANLDGVVNVLDDAFILVANLGTTSGASWTDGDFNGDGQVNVLGDAFVLVANLGRDVVPPVSAASQFAASSKLSSPQNSNLQSFSATVTTQRPALSLAIDQQGDSSNEEGKREVPLTTSGTPVLAGSQQLDDAFASEDWVI